MWENVLDWEHLPWLHRGSFRSIHCEDAGDWGWRARVAFPPPDPSASSGAEARIELRVDRPASRYVTRTLEGAGSGGEIWTRVEPRAAHSAQGRLGRNKEHVVPLHGLPADSYLPGLERDRPLEPAACCLDNGPLNSSKV